MRRLSALQLLVACCAALAVARPAAAGTGAAVLAFVGPTGRDRDEKPDARTATRAKDAGSVDGEVVSVDYRASRFTVKSGSATYDIVVLPSTDFEGRSNAFRGIADIKKGAHVSVMLSQRAATFTAQIIHLL